MNKKVAVVIVSVLSATCLSLAYWVKISRDRIVALENNMGALNVLAMDAGNATPEQIIELYKLAEDSLTSMKMMYDTLNTDNTEMMAQIEDQRTQIEALLKRAKNKDYDIKKLLAETQTLRNIMKGYIHQIDSLQQDNDRLFAEGQQAKQQAEVAENRSKTLETDLNSAKEIVKAGSVLSTGGFSATGVFARNSGAEATTDRAAKSNMIKTSFTLRENRIVKPGRKTLYLKVIGPKGNTIYGIGGGSFTATGQTDTFGASREIDYQGQDTDVSIYFTPTSSLDKGSYRLEIYESGNLIGKSEVVLK
jgi:hypothetical protein